jgi:hypothetical protein
MILRVLLYIFIIYPIKFVSFLFSLFIPKNNEDSASVNSEDEEKEKEERQILEES